jgi:hypothetical protein
MSSIDYDLNLTSNPVEIQGRLFKASAL